MIQTIKLGVHFMARAMKPHKNKPGQVEQVSSPGKIYHSRASKPSGIAKLLSTISNPPTQAEVQALADKLDALIDALKK